MSIRLKPLFKFFIVVAIIQFYSCSTEYNAKTIEGYWEVIEADVKMPDLSPTIIDAGKELALSSAYVFNDDSSYVETTNYYPEGIKGKWWVDMDSMILVLRNTDEEIPGNAEYNFRLESKRKMIWTQDYDGLGSIVLTLKKSNKEQ
ncbi:MAG: hypothetical protein ACI9JN_001816 [Bacteroidia bacterium]|jgi:hypothetical protein